MLTPSVCRRLPPELERRVRIGLESADRGDALGQELCEVIERARRVHATDEQVALALGIAVALSTAPQVKKVP